LSQATIADQPQLRRPSRLRLVDAVYHSLEEAILAGRVRPGERLVETAIAQQLEVSRTTVREAFLMLERRGLVVSKPRRGTFVTRLSRDDALDLGYTRALLEGYSLIVGYDRLDDEVLARLEAHLAEMRACRLPDDFPRLVEIDLAFHQAVVDCGRSSRVAELWRTLNGQLGALYLRGVEEQRLTIDGLTALHGQLLAAIRSRDPRVALDALIDHYVRASERGPGSLRGVAVEEVIRALVPRAIAGDAVDS